MNAPRQNRPTVSVVICCYSMERWDDLREAVASICGQQPPPNEIAVVVDHNPELRDLAEKTFKTLSPRPLIIENFGQRGLSSARNAGISATTSEIIAFLDDDAQASPGMLAALTRRVAEPGVMGASARILPRWRGGEPKWFPEEFLWTVGCTYRGLAPGPVRNLIGAAMAVRREVFDVSGGFNSDLGRADGPLPLGCEETELCIRASKANPAGRFIYEADAVCHHKVGGERLTLRYVLRRCYAEGLSKARLMTMMPSRAALSAERAYVLRVLPMGVCRGLLDPMRGRLHGLGRATTICAAFSATLAGYAMGRMRTGRSLRRTASAIEATAGSAEAR